MTDSTRLSLIPQEPLSGSRYCSKNEQGVSPNSDDWLLIRNKLAVMRLMDAIEDTKSANTPLLDHEEIEEL
jgi:hypothetical protein